MKNLFCCCCCCCFIFIFSGCSRNIPVHGNVSFSDGTPLRGGTVCFQNEILLSQGEIQSDGTFTLGTGKPNNGIPSGHYNVYISGAFQYEATPERKNEFEPLSEPKSTPLIEQKFMSPYTSGLSCDVTKGMKLPFNIVVEYP
jgi:hypothetical protein